MKGMVKETRIENNNRHIKNKIMEKDKNMVKKNIQKEENITELQKNLEKENNIIKEKQKEKIYHQKEK